MLTPTSTHRKRCKKVTIPQKFYHVQTVTLHEHKYIHIGEFTVDLCPQDGWTALMEASFKGYVDIVKMLIEAKAEINTQKKVSFSYHQKTHYTAYRHTQWNCIQCDCMFSQDDWTALHLAAQEGRVDVARLLIEAKANINLLTEV